MNTGLEKGGNYGGNSPFGQVLGPLRRAQQGILPVPGRKVENGGSNPYRWHPWLALQACESC
jgi:hypothetical protein